MAYRIEITGAAALDIDEAVAFIAKDSIVQASRWFEGLFDLMGTLSELPGRYILIPEAEELGRALRSVHHHSHRIVYEVNEVRQTVYVVRVWHGARRPLGAKDVD